MRPLWELPRSDDPTFEHVEKRVIVQVEARSVRLHALPSSDPNNAATE
jgi:hypothetical protein